MPFVQVVTNVPRAKVTQEALDHLTDIIANELDKPRQYVVVNIQPDQLMTFGASSEPCANITLSSIGRLGVEENKRYSKAIMESLEKDLGISPLRCFIFYNDYKASDVGYDRSTFHGIL